MHVYQMRAEYADGVSSGPVRWWHMVRDNGTTALCGRELDETAAIVSDEQWGKTAEPFCHTCGALYLRQVP
ncbi:hypothetical protein [Streptacidiphilus monticola]|uniref:Uncharacterized protein n=1 Tax=Streptacidiphilus monticola TaxID=2161674 RepID=A0ABW1FYY1_9ACTN